MRIVIILFISFLMLNADFLGKFYVEPKALKLSREQQVKLNNIVRQYHAFLRQWYIDFEKSNDDIVDGFSNSSLIEDSDIISNSIALENERASVERSFLLNIYEILSKEQRVIFAAKIRERENYSRILQNKFEDSQRLRQAEIDDSSFGKIGK